MRHLLTTIFCLTLILLVSCNNKPKETEAVQETSTNAVEAGKYCNEEYKFCIRYPSELFSPMEGAETATGNVFVSEDGLAQLRVFVGNYDGTITDPNEIKAAYEKDRNPSLGREITYQGSNPMDYTLRGYEGRTVFQQKTIVSYGKLVTAVLMYDNDVRDTFFPTLDPVFKSFK